MGSDACYDLPYLRATRRSFVTTSALGLGGIATGWASGQVGCPAAVLYCESEYRHDFQRGERLVFMAARLSEARAQFAEFIEGGCSWFELRCSYLDWFEQTYRSLWERESAAQDIYSWASWDDWYPHGAGPLDVVVPAQLVPSRRAVGWHLAEREMIVWMPPAVRATGEAFDLGDYLFRGLRFGWADLPQARAALSDLGMEIVLDPTTLARAVWGLSAGFRG